MDNEEKLGLEDDENESEEFKDKGPEMANPSGTTLMLKGDIENSL